MGKTICRFMLVVAAGLLATLLVPSRQAAGEGDFHRVGEQLRQILIRDAAVLELDMAAWPVALHSDLPAFYRERQYAPAWFEGQRLSEQARLLVDRVRQAEAEGLKAEDYHIGAVSALIDLLRIFQAYEELWNATALARLDILLTNTFLHYATDLTRGRVDPAVVYPREWRAVPRQADVLGTLRRALEQDRVDEALAEMVPAHPDYGPLREYLARYRQLAGEGGWPQIPAGRIVYPGQEDWRIPWLRRHLAQVGDLAEEETPSTMILDGDTLAALELFQQRHGLKADGVLGPETLAALNVTVEERIRQLEINLERLRWLPKRLGERYLLVNIAAFSLTVVERGEPVLQMPVVVGTPHRRTPIISSRLGYLIFSPYWNVPMTILREDKLPVIKANLEYLAEHHYEIVAWKDFPNRLLDPKALDWEKISAENFPGLLRQKPGPWNPLGQVKFMFSNDFAVYLHDTPQRHLFARNRRSFSSGCIRIERPFDLALYLLQDQKGWDADKIRQAMSADRPQRVDIPKPLPMHIIYQTAWVDGQGRLQTRHDLYQRDVALYAALRGLESPAQQVGPDSPEPDLPGLHIADDDGPKSPAPKPLAKAEAP